MTTIFLPSRVHSLAVAAVAAVIVAGAVATRELWPRETAAASPAAVPAWFAPIAKSYGDNPRITPGFDFAALYAAPRRH